MLMIYSNTVRLPGRNGVAEALQWGKVNKVFLVADYGREEKLAEIYQKAKADGITVELVNKKLLDKMVYDNQGVVAEVNLPGENGLEELLKRKRDAVVVMINHIDYEQNLGAVIRTSWATGVDAVVVAPSGVTAVTPVVAKISMGGAVFVPVYFQSLFMSLKMLHKYAIKVVGVEVGKGKSVFEAKLNGGIALLFGNEAKGLSEPLMAECDEMVHIPMASKIASVNLSVAAGVVLFERVRQAGVKGV